ncbi:hypothetical protein MBLNU459_g6687t1 [Dothideomycetes sp. NU459]
MRVLVGLAWFAAACGLSSVPSAAAAAIDDRNGPVQENHSVEKRYIKGANGTFNPFAANNLAVYFGRSQPNTNLDLYAICNTSNVDMVVMGFVSQFNGLDQLPNFNFGAGCSGSASKAASNITCPVLAQNITFCQTKGVKVFVSIGGSSSNVTFNTSTQAKQAAQTLWDVFGDGTKSNPSLRPFGNITVDGFDFDIENGTTQYYDLMASTLQAAFATSPKARYITAAPSCTNSTALPLGFYQNTNFVWPRFYNAGACGVHNYAGFSSSVNQWYTFLNGVTSTIDSLYPRMYIGALAFNNNVSGYVAPYTFSRDLVSARQNTTSKFGGAMLWEGSDGLMTKSGNGKNYLEITKNALISTSSARSLRSESVVIKTLAMIKGHVKRGARTRIGHC